MNIKNISILENEKWWGGCVNHGGEMPFDANSTATLDLYNVSPQNQTMPLLLSSKGRLIWCEEGFIANFNEGVISLESYGEILLEDTKGSLRTAYQESEKYTKTCKTTLPEVLFKVPQYNSWIELMYDQTEVEILKYADSILENSYTPGILMIDDNWQEDYGVWEFSAKRFNDPKSMIKKLSSLGFDLMLWVCPFISPDCQTFRYLEEKNFLIVGADGETAIRKWWNGFSAVLDLTNPGAWAWFKEKLDFLMEEYGVKGFKFDAGDLLNYQIDDKCYTNVTPLEQVQLYSKFAEQYPYNELRTGYRSAEYALAQRLCDKSHAWTGNGVSSLIPNGLLQNLLGYKYNCPDMIGGGEYRNFMENSDSLDEELVVRYAQIAIFFPIMQFSASPWRVLSKENSLICHEASEIHLKFSDYIIEQIKKANKENLPLMRHMALEYPQSGYEDVETQFMLGDLVLVAPATEKEQRIKKVHLPAGTWTADDGQVYTCDTDTTIEINVPLSRIPYFVKS